MKTKPCRAAIVFACLFLFAPSAFAQGQINGIAHLLLPNGKIANADWLRVLLVRTKVQPPVLPDLSGMEPFEQMETLRSLHMQFFISARRKMSNPDYVMRSTLTTPDGTFRFSDIAPGAYFILVTFPAMIQDYKVAWQEPVTVKDHQTVFIELNQDNLVIPTYSRQKD
ncbi:MAG: carboxypeptidase-like regulatory domain-containing protein [Deltaproteobacteria bacterium]|jgi:hypothetical protein